MTTPPTEARKKLIDRTIKELKSFGIWYQLDVLYFFAAETQQAALLNWIKNAHNATAVNSPTFTVDRGFTGDGATSYINSNFTPLSQGVRYLGASAMIAIYSRTNSTGAIVDVGSRDGSLRWTQVELRSASDTLYTRFNSNAAGGPNGDGRLPTYNTDSRGFFSVNRVGDNYDVIKAGAIINTLTLSVTGSPSQPSYIGAMNNNGTALFFTQRQIAATAFGGSLSASQHYHFNRIVEYYMDQVGAGVQ